MADSTQEKTEQPTSKRLEEARNEGQVAYSKELTGALMFLLILIALKITGQGLIASLVQVFTRAFQLPLDALSDGRSVDAYLGGAADLIVKHLVPIGLLALASTIAPAFAQIGVNFSAKPLAPDLSKLDPIKGTKKLFSLDKVVQVVQSILKMGLVGVICWITIRNAMPRFVDLGQRDLDAAVICILELLFLVGFRVAAGLFVLGIADVLYRRWKHTRNLMMTKEEVKEERKKSDGDPRIKGRIREVQRQMALQRMKSDVREADVVVRNPTHYAVALKYDEGEVAPRVVAKGRALMALSIIEIAEAAGVEVVENRPLARELYRSVRVGEFVPERLFKAVAEVLAFVFKKRRRGSRSARKHKNEATTR